LELSSCFRLHSCKTLGHGIWKFDGFRRPIPWLSSTFRDILSLVSILYDFAPAPAILHRKTAEILEIWKKLNSLSPISCERGFDLSDLLGTPSGACRRSSVRLLPGDEAADPRCGGTLIKKPVRTLPSSPNRL
jgi:hypothetical protein